MELVHRVRTDRPEPNTPSELVARREVARLTECVNAALVVATE
jgi:hypothetical protein